MQTVDWIVIGGGMTGAALAYELVQQGFSVRRLERHFPLQGATRYGYGGIAYWSGTTPLTRQLCQEGIARQRSLPEELEADTQFRELDLLLTIAPDADPQTMAQMYQQFAIPPRLLTVEAACELEPLLHPGAIAGALTVKHGHVSTEAMTAAYYTAFLRKGGQMQVGTVTGLRRDGSGSVIGVDCGSQSYAAGQVAVCAGGLTRSLLQTSGIHARIYFTHAELVEMPPAAVTLRTLVMPANTQRFALEAAATQPELEPLWNQVGQEITAPVLDPGAVQLQDGRIRIGQISRTLSDPTVEPDPEEGETEIRTAVGQVLPALQSLPGTWHHCLIAFSGDRLPLIGAIPAVTGIHLFSGFSNPLAIVPPLAKRFAQQAASGNSDDLLAHLSPARFQVRN